MTTNELLNGLSIIASLVLIEGLLSVDNVLGIAAIARNLPPEKRQKAIRIGMAGAYIFRVVALFFIGFLKDNLWVRWLGAGYLIYLMCSQLVKPRAEGGPHAGDLDDAVKAGAGTKLANATFGAVLMQIGLMDLSLSVDNVIAAVALAGDTMWAIYAGVLIAIFALQALAGVAIRLLDKHPILEPTAFMLLGFVGAILVYEAITGVHLHSAVKFAGILVIIATTLSWDRSPIVKRIFVPVIAVAMPIMRLINATVSAIFRPIGMLFKAKAA
jgi:tellurite resistance protein TerC